MRRRSLVNAWRRTRRTDYPRGTVPFLSAQYPLMSSFDVVGARQCHPESPRFGALVRIVEEWTPDPGAEIKGIGKRIGGRQRRILQFCTLQLSGRCRQFQGRQQQMIQSHTNTSRENGTGRQPSRSCCFAQRPVDDDENRGPTASRVPLRRLQKRGGHEEGHGGCPIHVRLFIVHALFRHPNNDGREYPGHARRRHQHVAKQSSRGGTAVFRDRAQVPNDGLAARHIGRRDQQQPPLSSLARDHRSDHVRR